jgi:uncharacterized protein with HEPN domain
VTRSSLERWRDAKAHALSALANGGGLSAEALAESPQPLHAVLYDLVIIGEALGRVPNSIQTLCPDVPWRAASNLRNVIVHAYWQIDLETIARILDRQLDPMIDSLDGLIALLEREELP